MSIYRGIWPAMLTPFDADGEVDLPAVDRLVDYLLDQGAHGLYLCGSTGEGLLMSVPERQAVTARVMQRVRGRVPVMVHVGAVATRDAVALAAHAREVNAEAVSAIPPIFFPVGFKGLTEHYRAIGAAAQLPLFVYNIPQLAGVNVTPAMVAQLREAIPQVVGMKFTAFNFYEMRQIIEQGLTVMSGPDEMCLPALTMGVTGAIGSTYNIMMSHFAHLYDAFVEGRLAEAQERQYLANRVIKVFLDHPGALKVMMRWQGVPLGDPRPPLETLAPEREESLRAALKAIGYPYPTGD